MAENPRPPTIRLAWVIEDVPEDGLDRVIGAFIAACRAEGVAVPEAEMERRDGR